MNVFHHKDFAANPEEFVEFVRGQFLEGFLVQCNSHPNLLRVNTLNPRAITTAVKDSNAIVKSALLIKCRRFCFLHKFGCKDTKIELLLYNISRKCVLLCHFFVINGTLVCHSGAIFIRRDALGLLRENDISCWQNAMLNIQISLFLAFYCHKFGKIRKY